jgi:hypothetical protein
LSGAYLGSGEPRDRDAIFAEALLCSRGVA